MTIPSSRKWLLRATAVAAALCVFYLVGLPAIELLLQRFRPAPPSIRVLQDLTFTEQVRLHAAELFVALWTFSFGAMIGSFLNVVVYRLPRGESIVLRGSHCPRCGAPIASRDNLPIVGWLLLGGRCRICRGAISPRYPIVEFLTASLFLTLYFVQLRSGGANLPVRTPNHYTGVVWIIFYTRWDLVGLTAYHAYLLCTLLAWSLIEGDGQRVPRRAAGVSLLLGLIPLLIWPSLVLVPLSESGAANLSPDTWRVHLITVLAGGAAGAFFGWLLTLFAPQRPGTARPSTGATPTVGSTLIGLGLGWQAIALSVAAAAVIRGVAVALLTRSPDPHPNQLAQRVPATAYLFLAVFAHHLFWRPLYQLLFT